MRRKHTEASVVAAIQEKYPPPAYATFPQVASATGDTKKRFADCLSICLYPSRGLEITGFEVKCNRSDWLRELSDPAKAEEVAQYCDRWYVVGTKDVVFPGEVPVTWGFALYEHGNLTVPRLAPLLRSKPVTREFLAGILRAADKHYRLNIKEITQIEVEKAKKEAQSQAEASADFRESAAKASLEKLKKEVADFESKAGISITGWNRADGKDFADFLAAKDVIRDDRLNVMESMARKILDSIDAARVLINE